VSLAIGRAALYRCVMPMRRPRPPARLERARALPAGGNEMHDNIYKVIELVGSSQNSIEDAIQSAIARASQSLKNLRWCEVTQTRAHIEAGKVSHYQVVLKVGFTLQE
jgi:flavin-binding protein dodecin